jgi:hypothetical protein
MSAVWRQSSGLPTGIGNGGNWPTDWQITPDASAVGPAPVQKTVKNGANGGPNIFADPVAAYSAFDQTLPGQSGNRNAVRGDGFFTIDVGLGKRFTLFPRKDNPITLQIRGEALNVTNTVRFDPQSINAQIGEPGTFGNLHHHAGKPASVSIHGPHRVLRSSGIMVECPRLRGTLHHNETTRHLSSHHHAVRP